MKRLIVGLMATTPLWPAYQYYLTDSLTSIDPAKWSVTGTLSPTLSGLASTDANGGSLISRVPVPDGSNEAEIGMTLALTSSGGGYTLFLQASGDARTSRTGSGSYLALEMQNPRFDASGKCVANFVLLQSAAGAVSALASFQHGCRNGMVIRLAAHGNTFLVWPDQGTPMEFPVGLAPGGQPGIGLYGTPPGNAVSQVQLGAIGRAAPAALAAGRLTFGAFPREVDLQWPAVAAGVNAPSLAGYWVYRDGVYLGRTTLTSFSDETAVPSSVHTYTVQAVDQHYNFSAPVSVTVAVPASPLSGPRPAPADPARPPKFSVTPGSLPTKGPAAAGVTSGTEPRRIGVRANGSYWGGAGEQIDTLSGNLNFMMPLLKPQARGGWSVTFSLSYNSQIWRQDSSGTSLLGQDVGYGLGWKLLAGAITAVWSGPSTIDHYLYTDSSGAEYRLDQNSGGVWTSQEGVYVSFDQNTGRLYFPDGSYWEMFCLSQGNEQDAGTNYPTLMSDTNGNQLS